MTSGNRLLIVDDEADAGALFARVAVECGYDVTLCSDPARMVRELADARYTHIILDLVMPGLDGIEALRELAQAHSRARIVILSGTGAKIVDAARRFGVESGLEIAGGLVKPVRMAELRALLAEIHNDTSWLTRAALEQAIGHNALCLEYQPKLHLASGRVAGVEALLRWRHAQRGPVAAGDFLPFAETEGLLDRINDIVVQGVLTQMKAWRGAGLDCSVSINLPPHIIHQADLADRLAAACAGLGVAPRLVTLEFSETAAMRDALRAVEILTRLRLKGFELSIDDFGTGVSSLVQLQRLPFGELKIDRSFIRELDINRDALVIVRAMIDLAHNLGLKTCAEGVEGEAAMQRLAELRCDCVQGHHIAPPLPADAVPGWVSARAAA